MTESAMRGLREGYKAYAIEGFEPYRCVSADPPIKTLVENILIYEIFIMYNLIIHTLEGSHAFESSWV